MKIPSENLNCINLSNFRGLFGLRPRPLSLGITASHHFIVANSRDKWCLLKSSICPSAATLISGNTTSIFDDENTFIQHQTQNTTQKIGSNWIRFLLQTLHLRNDDG